MPQAPDSTFHLELLRVAPYRDACSRRETILRRAAVVDVRARVQQIFSLCDCGRFEELGPRLNQLSVPTLSKSARSQLTRREQKKLDTIDGWYTGTWLPAETRRPLAEYSISGDLATRSEYVLVLGKLGALDQLAQDFARHFKEYKTTRSVQRNVLIFCLRQLLASQHANATLLLEFYNQCDALWEEDEILDTLLQHWELVRGDLFLECAVHMTAARVRGIEVQRLARRHSGLDTTTIADPQPSTRKAPSEPWKSSSHRTPRVAVCISGMLRDADRGAAGIRRHLVEPLGADVFVDTWDEEQIWLGLGGSRGMARVFGAEIARLLPKKLRRVAAFRNAFPAVAQTWGTPVTRQLTPQRIDALYAPEARRLQPDVEFVSTIEQHPGLRNSGTFNQARMFYKVQRCFELMTNYEQREGFQYDYVIRIRPDFVFMEDLAMRELSELASDEVRVDRVYPVGPSDMFAVGRRRPMEIAAQLWDTMLASRRVSPFPAYSDIRSHRLLWVWLERNGINLTVTHAKSELSTGLVRSAPAVALELEQDLRGPAQSHQGAKWVDKFFSAACAAGDDARGADSSAQS